MKIDIKKSITWANAIATAKAIVVICAFLAFALSMRQKEFDRFSVVKPLFEIYESTGNSSFKLINHGGVVYFAGCASIDAGELLRKTPRQYSTLSKTPVEFAFSAQIKESSRFTCHYRDIDLNSYVLKVVSEKTGFYIDGVPIAYRSNLFVSMARAWLDGLVTFIFPKDWYSEGDSPDDSSLIVKWPWK